MDTFMTWMTEKVGPKSEQIARNPWVAGIKHAIDVILPFILVGSLVTVYGVVRNFLPSLPDLKPISTYTFGLIGLFMAFLIPYFIMENKKQDKNKFIAGITGLALFLMIVKPEVTDAGYLFQISSFGAGGMFVSIVSGLFVSLVMLLYGKFSFFKEDCMMPSFIQQWFNSLLPIFTCVFIGWLIVIQLNFDLFTFIQSLFEPLTKIAQTYPGMLLLGLLPVVFYTLGISSWVFTPILAPISLAAIAANVDAGANNIFCDEVVFTFIALGGRGCTLALNFLMLKCKSTKYKVLGKTCLGPGILNINEPLMFGTVAFNPMLMLPCWLICIVTTTITYFSMKFGLVPIPHAVFSMWYCPIFLSGFFVSGLAGVLLTLVNFVLSGLIWYPFLKVADRQQLELEANAEDDDEDEDEDY